MFLYTWIVLASQLIGLYLWYGKTPTMYAKALELIRSKNILFIKVFQSLANSNNIKFSPEFQTQLQIYNAHTSYTDDEINYECLDYIETKYSVLIDRHVLNSGMIALVFKGTNSTGQPIIVKLKRRNIQEQLRVCCTSVTELYNWFSYFFPTNMCVLVLKPFIMNIHDIIDQTDFAQEIENTKHAKEDYSILDFITIPTIYNVPEPNPEYILMEFIEGTHTIPPDADRDMYMEKFGIFTCYAFLYNAIQHTDLHNGNYLFTEKGFGIIDFGMAIQMSDEMHDIVLSIAAIIRDQPPLHEIDFIDTFKDLFIPPLDRATLNDVSKVEDLCIKIARPLFDSIDMDELNILTTTSQLSQYTGHEIVFNKDVYKMLLGVSMMGAKTVIMGPNYSYENFIRLQRISLRKAYMLIMDPDPLT